MKATAWAEDYPTSRYYWVEIVDDHGDLSAAFLAPYTEAAERLAKFGVASVEWK